MALQRRMEIVHLLLTVLYFVSGYVVKLPFECRYNSDGRWIVYNTRKITLSKNLSFNSYSYTFEICRRNFQHCFREKFRTEFRYSCTPRGNDIFCPFPNHILSDVQVRLRGTNISLTENFTTEISASPFRNCSCEWKKMKPIEVLYSKQTLYFIHNTSIAVDIMRQIVDVSTCDNKRLRCSSHGNNIYQYNCRVTCQSLSICIQSSLRHCRNDMKICKNFSQPIVDLLPNSVKCIVTDYVIMTWNVPPTHQNCNQKLLQYSLFDTNDHRLLIGETEKTTFMTPAPENSDISKAGVRLCCSDHCTKMVNISCYHKSTISTTKDKKDKMLIVMGVVAAMLLLILGVLIKFISGKLSKSKEEMVIHPAIDGHVSLDEIQNIPDDKEDLEFINPYQNEYEEISTFQFDESKMDDDDSDGNEEYFSHLNLSSADY